MRPEILNSYFKPITSLKGVGPALATTLHRVMATHLETLPRVRDLLFYPPIDIVDRSFSPPIYCAPDDAVCTFEVTVDTHIPPGSSMRHASKKPYRVQCSNETGDMMLVFFHVKGDWVEKALPVGKKRIVSGKTEHFDFRLQMTHPDIIALPHEKDKVIGMEPIYPLTQGLTNKKLRSLIEGALADVPELVEWYAEGQLENKGNISFNDALSAVHHPQSLESLEPGAPARVRLAFDELVAEQLMLQDARAKLAKQEGLVLAASNADLWQQLTNHLPFTLTQSQQEVLGNINEGLVSGKRYIRLLQGDVGSGKTIIALFAMLRAVENGYQAALMVPTEIVAQQHFYKLRELCEPIGIKVSYLTGSVKGADRKDVLVDIESGAAQIVIGTHALFQDKVTFHSLALVVIDEQHRFGVEQRMALVSKGKKPHILHMTATPIPRSLMMTYYGDMEPLYLREKPMGRLPITTRVVPLSRSEELLVRLQAALDADEKVYWICPQIEVSAQTDLIDRDIAAVEFRYTEFRARFGDKVALIHGRIPQAQRDVIMRKFARGEIKMLVATTVIEVGVDVPDATIMVIESAERFGLSQLHQLRGRVGRGEKQSYCILLYKDTADEIARTRLTTLREHDDGFAIAEMDFQIRGGGELMGTRQSGGRSYYFVKPVHMEMLPEAHKLAKAMSGKEAAEVLKELFA